MPTAVLQYATRDLHTPRRIPAAVFPILLAFAHINLCWQLSQTMIAPVCWAEHLDFTVWAPAAWIPGTLLARSIGPLGLLVMILPSILAGLLLWQLITRFVQRQAAPFGPLAWRLPALLLLWACWIPVPAPYSVAFLFAQWATNS